MYQDDRSTCRAIVIIITPFVFFKMSLTCRDNFFVVKNVMTFKTCPLVRIGPNIPAMRVEGANIIHDLNGIDIESCQGVITWASCMHGISASRMPD